MKPSDPTPPQESKALVEVRDLLGVSKAAELLVEAIVRGVGKLIGPWQRGRDAKTDREIVRVWDEQVRKLGLQATAAQLTLEDRANVRWSNAHAL